MEIIFALTTVAAFALLIIGLIKPTLVWQKTRGGVGTNYGAATVISLMLFGSVAAPEGNFAAEPSATRQPLGGNASAIAAPNSESPQPKPRPDLTTEELEAYFTESTDRVADLTNLLAERYKKARENGQYHGYNQWRSNDWSAELDALRIRYDGVLQTHRQQILWTDLKGIFTAPAELSVASVQLSGRIDRDDQDQREALFKQKVKEIAEGYRKAEAHLRQVKEENKSQET